jgi:hypothetical protein
MPDYQKMYHALFNEVSDIIRQLQQIQLKNRRDVCGKQGAGHHAAAL